MVRSSHPIVLKTTCSLLPSDDGDHNGTKEPARADPEDERWTLTVFVQDCVCQEPTVTCLRFVERHRTLAVRPPTRLVPPVHAVAALPLRARPPSGDPERHTGTVGRARIDLFFIALSPSR